MSAILNSAILDILDSDTLLSFLRFTQKHSHSNQTLTQINSIWLIDDGSHLELCHLGSSHLSTSQTHSHLPRFIPTIWQKKTHSFILTQPDHDSHLEFCHDRFSHCHLGFRHLVIFSQIHKNTLTPLRLWLKLIQSYSDSFILIWWQLTWLLPSWIQPTLIHFAQNSLKNSILLKLIVTHLTNSI